MKPYVWLASGKRLICSARLIQETVLSDTQFAIVAASKSRIRTRTGPNYRGGTQLAHVLVGVSARWSELTCWRLRSDRTGDRLFGVVAVRLS
jgi:hypothetical protein